MSRKTLIGREIINRIFDELPWKDEPANDAWRPKGEKRAALHDGTKRTFRNVRLGSASGVKGRCRIDYYTAKSQ